MPEPGPEANGALLESLEFSFPFSHPFLEWGCRPCSHIPVLARQALG